MDPGEMQEEAEKAAFTPREEKKLEKARVDVVKGVEEVGVRMTVERAAEEGEKVDKGTRRECIALWKQILPKEVSPGEATREMAKAQLRVLPRRPKEREENHEKLAIETRNEVDYSKLV